MVEGINGHKRGSIRIQRLSRLGNILKRGAAEGHRGFLWGDRFRPAKVFAGSIALR